MSTPVDNANHEQVRTDDIHDFIDFTMNRREVPPDTIPLYRGQSQFFRLIPMIGRFDDSKRPIKDLELEIFKQFKRLAAGKIPDGIDAWNLLSLARHHGLPTRLLDWTENPLAALYFATRTDPKTGNISVWRYCVPEHRILDPHSSRYTSDAVFVMKDLGVFQPDHLDDRIAGQSGWMTSHPLRGEDYKAQHGTWYLDLKREAKQGLKEIMEIIMPASSFLDVREGLQHLGVHNAVLFPGTDGICETLREKYLPASLGAHHRDPVGKD